MLSNPFNITKAADLTDEQIHETWVDLPGEGGFDELANPNSPMPMIILGGKGSGKTHLMRHFSFSLQRLRQPNLSPVEVARRDGYVGLYVILGGLNPSRFKGKGQSEEVWETIFTYYMDLWLAQLTIATVESMLVDSTLDVSALESDICAKIFRLFDEVDGEAATSFRGVTDLLRNLQKQVDVAVNNLPLTGTLPVRVQATRGALVFGIPQAIISVVSALKDVQFVYLIDEIENVSAEQQRYINTLIREKRPPSTFKIGGRLYGMRTYSTYSAEEDILQGSEYERVFLDDLLRANRNYPAFARMLCARRLVEAGYAPEGSVEQLAKRLDGFFEVFPESPYGDAEADFVHSRIGDFDRPYFSRLRSTLRTASDRHLAPGVKETKDIDLILSSLRYPKHPLLEKINIFLFFRAWQHTDNLVRAAEEIGQLCAMYLQNPKAKGDYYRQSNHFRDDLLAQLLRDYDQRQRYLGIRTFIEMSMGLPRNLLIIIKHIYKWAVFNGEQPFQNGPISVGAQQQGVLEASDWFYSNARITGPNGVFIRDAITRLGNLFRDIRFSDKPSECSLSTFSVDLTSVSPQAREIIESAEQWSLLIATQRGQRDRNSNRVDMKYRLNGMLCPRWDLPIASRGAIALTADEANAIFDPEIAPSFDQFRRDRVARMNAPFKTAASHDQHSIFSDD